MSINVEIITKPQNKISKDIKITCSSDVLNLKDVQAIRNAIREHLLFLGLDNGNNVVNISLLGIGTSNKVLIDTKEIIRLALLTASENVILVHNHPSNNLKPSKDDLHITYVTNEILKAFQIKLLDHIIVTEKEHISMKKEEIMKSYYEEDKKIENMDKGLLVEENIRLKEKLEELERSLNNSIEVLSAKYVGNYNDSSVYSVKISLNGKIENIELERLSDTWSEQNKWKVISNFYLNEKDKDYIIQIVSKNPPTMFLDVPEKVYADNSIEEIGMGE